MIIHKQEPKVSPYRHIVNTSMTTDPVQACPVCGDPYVHLRDVQVCQNHTTTLCCGDDAAVTRSTKPSPNRGSTVTIRFVGECQHYFAYSWTFHKGNTAVTLHDVGTLPVGHWPSELWRD